jgi:2-aminoethylphosphonate-pyruvate transaminase
MRDDEIEYVAMVHHETSSGTLNPLNMVGKLCKKYNKKLIVDAISSIAVQDIDVVKDGITYLAGSSNKGIGGPEGISFVIVEKAEFEDMIGRNFYLSLRENKFKQDEGQTLFTPAVRIFMGFNEALDELREEGLDNRKKRFAEIALVLRSGMKELGFKQLTEVPSNVTTLFELGNNTFTELHKKLKMHNFIIYTGRDSNTFRLCTFGDLVKEDAERFIEIMRKLQNDKGNNTSSR